MGLPAFPCAQLLVFWGGMQCGFDGFAHNPVEYARHVACPTLLLQGEQDTRARLQDALAHESYIEAQPDEWKQSVTDFLKQFDSTSEPHTEAH